MGGAVMAEQVTDAAEQPAPAGDPFAGLSEQASMIEAGQAPGAPAVAAPADTTADELLGALSMARLILAPGFAWWPEFGTVWGDATLRGIADGGAAVMQKHGWTMGDVFTEWGPYFALIGATAPPAFATYQAMMQRKEEARRERTKPAAD